MNAQLVEKLAGRRIIASVSGGKDSAAMSLHLNELGISHERVFMDTGWEHPATYEYLRGPLTLATRVGCWPCIHARKTELALVARIDPKRIRAIADQEATLNEVAMSRDLEKGRPFTERSMFSYKGNDKHYPLPIFQAVSWAQSKRGEWQPAGAAEGCMRHGICETEAA